MKRASTGTGSRNSVRKNPSIQQQRKPNQTQTARQANLKQFKMEIDLQIEKCLDNLDKNGLKYLRQTLKNSNIFNEQISEIINTQNIKQNAQSPTKPKNSQQIQQEIVEDLQQFYDKQQQPSKQKTFLGSNTNKPLKQQKPITVKLQKFQNKIQEPLKPFTRRIQSRQGSNGKSQEQKALIIQRFDSKIIKQQQQIKDKSQIDMIVQKITQLPQQKIKKLGKIIERLQRSQKLQDQQLQGLKTRPYMLKPDQSVPNQSSMKQSSYRQKRNQKATSLYNQIIKGNKKTSPQVQKGQQQKSPTYQKHQQQVINQNQISEQISQIQIQNQVSEPKKMDIPDRMFKYQNSPYPEQNSTINAQQKQEKQDEKFQSIMGKKSGSQIIKKGSFLKNFPISNIKKPLDIEVTQSHQADTLQLNQGNSSKMVRLGKKKLGTNKVKLVLLRNRGHPTIIGLTSVQFYNVNGKLIPISLQNLKSQSSAKLLKLFNGVYNTINEQQMFTTIFKRDYQIELQIPQKIGGVKIWNYNKSQIQSSKETDWIQIYINDRLSWEGLIKKGSYNEITDYCTLAEIQQGFKFQNFKTQLYKINEVSQNQHALYIGKTKDKDVNKVDWLQKTLMQQKIKKIEEEEEKNKQTSQFRKTGTKVNRFSQLYQEEESTNKFNTIKKQQSEERKIELNFKQKQPQPIIQRVNRTNSKRIQEQKDIFSNFGQNFIKQKIKSNQINAKVNQISEKVQKLKQTYKKQQFGYSSLINKQEAPEKKVQKIQPKISIQIKQKKNYQKQSLDDFMNDSIFQDPAPKIEKKLIQRTSSRIGQKQSSNQIYNMKRPSQKPKVQMNQNNKVDIDDFLNQLNDLVGTKQNRYQFGNEKQKFITIPQLPKGNKIQLLFLSNWGDVQYIGINKIQFFDSQGQRVYPSQAKSNIQNSSINTVFSQNKGYLNQQSDQWKCAKKQDIKISIAFSKKIQFSLIRFWNFVGDRVHSMIGVRKIQILLDGSIIFMGDLRKNAGNSRDQIFKSCEPLLFTNNVIIQKRIVQNDWLAQQLQFQKQQTIIFKKTLQNFMRPLTNGLSQKQIKLNQNKQGIKLPKRNCFQYDPPTLPSGYYIKLILHKTWGDRDFIGLNGIVIFDQKGSQIIDVKKISQFPAPLVTLSGYQKDKRILDNLFNGKNLTSNDQSIWLAPYLRDVDKMQKQAENAILIQFDKICTISAINFYNYAKTPQRGVRQIQIFIDNFLIYRGYLRLANVETGQILTTINFTKDPTILEKVGYVGYNEDNLGQEVNFYNEGKPQKAMF